MWRMFWTSFSRTSASESDTPHDKQGPVFAGAPQLNLEIREMQHVQLWPVLVADKGTEILPVLNETQRVQLRTILVTDKNHLEVFFTDRQGPRDVASVEQDTACVCDRQVLSRTQRVFVTDKV